MILAAKTYKEVTFILELYCNTPRQTFFVYNL